MNSFLLSLFLFCDSPLSSSLRLSNADRSCPEAKERRRAGSVSLQVCCFPGCLPFRFPQGVFGVLLRTHSTAARTGTRHPSCLLIVPPHKHASKAAQKVAPFRFADAAPPRFPDTPLLPADVCFFCTPAVSMPQPLCTVIHQCRLIHKRKRVVKHIGTASLEQPE